MLLQHRSCVHGRRTLHYRCGRCSMMRLTCQRVSLCSHPWWPNLRASRTLLSMWQWTRTSGKRWWIQFFKRAMGVKRWNLLTKYAPVLAIILPLRLKIHLYQNAVQFKSFTKRPKNILLNRCLQLFTYVLKQWCQRWKRYAHLRLAHMRQFWQNVCDQKKLNCYSLSIFHITIFFHVKKVA